MVSTDVANTGKDLYDPDSVIIGRGDACSHEPKDRIVEFEFGNVFIYCQQELERLVEQLHKLMAERKVIVETEAEKSAAHHQLHEQINKRLEAQKQ